MDKNKLLADLDKTVTEFKRLVHEETEWEEYYAGDDYKIHYNQPSYWAGTCFRFTTELTTPMEAVSDAFSRENTLKWDKNYESIEDEELAEKKFVRHAKMKSTFEGLVSPRDGVLVSGHINENDTIYQAQGSVDLDSLYPVPEGFVRSWAYPMGICLERHDRNKTKLTMIYQAELNGWVPYMVVYNGMGLMIDVWIKALIKYLEDHAETNKTAE